MPVIVEAILRTIFAFAVLLTASRIIGRKLISQFTFFDFVSAITLGTLGATIALPAANSFWGAVAALASFTILTILIGFGDIYSFTFRKLVNSEPVVVISNGKIVRNNMKKVRVSLNQLMILLRQKNAFNIADVEFAVLESSGELSVQLKSQKQPLTPSDLNIPTVYKGLTRDVIMDGAVMHSNLQGAGLDEQWLKQQLEKQGIGDAEDVFYAGLDTTGSLYISLKNRQTEEIQGQYGLE